MTKQAGSPCQFILLLAGLVLLCCGPRARAQVQEEINIIKSYKPELTKAVKLDVQPQDPELNLREPELTYTPEPVYRELTPARTQLPGVSLGQQQLDPLRSSHLKIGGGNYANFLTEATYNTKRNDNQVLSAYARHNSGRGPVDKSDFSEQVLRLRGKQLFDRATLTAKPFLKRNRFHRYGYASGLDPDQRNIQQNYLRYGLMAGLHNDRTDTSTVDYQVNATGRSIQTPATTAGRETDIELGGHVKEYLSGNAARIDAQYRLLDYRNGRGAYTRNVVKFGGRYILNSANYGKAELGFRTASIADSTDEPFRFYPYVRVSYPLMTDTLTLFGGIKGNLKPNSYHGLTSENPFLGGNANLRNTNRQFDIFAGAKGHWGEEFKYLTRFSYRNVEDMALYINDQRQQRQFRVVYDSAITTVFQVHTELDYQPVEQFEVGLALNFRNFNMGALAEPWHRPKLDYQLTGRYHFGDKIRLRAALHGFGQREVLENGSAKTLNAILDINTGIDYRFSKTFTAFFNFRNLLGTQYQYWNQYPVRGFHVTGGLKLNLFE